MFNGVSENTTAHFANHTKHIRTYNMRGGNAEWLNVLAGLQETVNKGPRNHLTSCVMSKPGNSKT